MGKLEFVNLNFFVEVYMFMFVVRDVFKRWKFYLKLILLLVLMFNFFMSCWICLLFIGILVFCKILI